MKPPRKKWAHFVVDLALPPERLEARDAWRDVAIGILKRTLAAGAKPIHGAVAVDLATAVGDHDLDLISSTINSVLRAAGIIDCNAVIVSRSIGMDRLVAGGLCRVTVRRTTPPATRISAELRQRNSITLAARHGA